MDNTFFKYYQEAGKVLTEKTVLPMVPALVYAYMKEYADYQENLVCDLAPSEIARNLFMDTRTVKRSYITLSDAKMIEELPTVGETERRFKILT